MTLAQQIQTLQSRGLIIADTNKAEQVRQNRLLMLSATSDWQTTGIIWKQTTIRTSFYPIVILRKCWLATISTRT